MPLPTQLNDLSGKEITRLSFNPDLTPEDRATVDAEIRRRQETSPQAAGIGSLSPNELAEMSSDPNLGAMAREYAANELRRRTDAEMTHVIVSHIDVPFTDLMVLLFKLTLAAIPVGVVFGGAWFLLHALLAHG